MDKGEEQGIDITSKYIPAEVFDKRAVEKRRSCSTMWRTSVAPHVKGNRVSVELTTFSIISAARTL